MHDTFLFFHFIGLSMAVGTGFANIFLGTVAAKLPPAERGSFMGKTMILVRMGQTGLGLLILTGFYLITPYWAVLSSMPTLIAKLIFVALQIIMVTITSLIARKAKKENNPALFTKLKPLGILTFVIGITIVVLAVVTFH